jgi:hypothetical protein
MLVGGIRSDMPVWTYLRDSVLAHLGFPYAAKVTMIQVMVAVRYSAFIVCGPQ